MVVKSEKEISKVWHFQVHLFDKLLHLTHTEGGFAGFFRQPTEASYEFLHLVQKIFCSENFSKVLTENVTNSQTNVLLLRVISSNHPKQYD